MFINILFVYIFVNSLVSCNKHWDLIWRDEFEGPLLNRSQWVVTNEWVNGKCLGEFEYYIINFVIYKVFDKRVVNGLFIIKNR